MNNFNYHYLKDYRSLDFKIEKVNLTFFLDLNKTKVINNMIIKRINFNSKSRKIIFDGVDLKLISLKLNGVKLEPEQYLVLKNKLIIFDIFLDDFNLEFITEIYPIINTSLEGLYVSNNMLYTQNEPQGFRKITYFIDRPDNMSLYTTKIVADKTKFPHLLSNGNKISSGILKNNKHFVIWEDPFYKPSYLFALVAGKFFEKKGVFKTKSKKRINISIYSDKKDLSILDFALTSLKKAMLWDEQNFDRECDLNSYKIVAVDSFNMGAMENKGLNIFNSQINLFPVVYPDKLLKKKKKIF